MPPIIPFFGCVVLARAGRPVIIPVVYAETADGATLRPLPPVVQKIQHPGGRSRTSKRLRETVAAYSVLWSLREVSSAAQANVVEDDAACRGAVEDEVYGGQAGRVKSGVGPGEVGQREDEGV